MCLLYFRIYRETVKRRKELHLLQAQHHSSLSQIISINTTSNSRIIKNMSTTEQDESVSTDSNRSPRNIDKTTKKSNRYSPTTCLYCCWKR